MEKFGENYYDPLARKLVEKLDPVPELDKATVGRGHQRILSEARSLAGEARQPAFAHQQDLDRTPDR